MKARRKGTNEPFQKVASVCLCSGGYILIKDVEFEQEPTVEIPFGAKDSELQEVTYYIPNGYHAEINGNAVVIKKGELINNTLSQDHWQDVRERAAIAAMQGLLAQSGDAYTELVIAREAVIYADALVKKLKGE